MVRAHGGGGGPDQVGEEEEACQGDVWGAGSDALGGLESCGRLCV